MTIATESGCEVADQARRFLEHARVDSLPCYIDMLLVVDGSPIGEHDKYMRWFAALGMIERSLLPRIRGLAIAVTAGPARGSCPRGPDS